MACLWRWWVIVSLFRSCNLYSPLQTDPSESLLITASVCAPGGCVRHRCLRRRGGPREVRGERSALKRQLVLDILDCDVSGRQPFCSAQTGCNRKNAPDINSSIRYWNAVSFMHFGMQTASAPFSEKAEFICKCSDSGRLSRLDSHTGARTSSYPTRIPHVLAIWHPAHDSLKAPHLPRRPAGSRRNQLLEVLTQHGARS